MIRRILVALGGTPHTTACVHHALELAELHDAELTGVTVRDTEALTQVGSVPVGAGKAASELVHYRHSVSRERIEEAVRDFQERCRCTGKEFRIVHEEGEPFEKLLSLWRYHDLTVLSLRGLFEYGAVQNPDDQILQLIRSGLRPILAASERFQQIERVIIAYNGSIESANAMRQFAQMKLWPKPSLRVLCFGRNPDKAKVVLRDAEDYFRAHEFEVDSEWIPGSARQHLLPYSRDWDADLIVMGSTRRNRLVSKVLGDTALHCIRNAEIPLFLGR